MSEKVQLSALISPATAEKLARFTASQASDRNAVVEQALLAFMQAYGEHPAEADVPTRLVIATEAYDRIIELIENPPPPTKALRALMQTDDD